VSRSLRAWARGCESVGAAARGVRGLGQPEVREHLGAERLTDTASSLATLTRVATVVMLMAALFPAAALGDSASRSGKAARAAQGASRTPLTPFARGSGPPRSSGQHRHRQTHRVDVLGLGSGYAGAHGSRPVEALQRRLAQLGYAPGSIDGRYGRLTEAAVIRFQATHGLVADGIDGTRTSAALASAKLVLGPGDGYVRGGSGLVRALQRRLAAAGFSPGAIDGRYGPRTEQAVDRFQTARHLVVDGFAGPQTLGQLQPARPRHAAPGPRLRPAPRKAHPRPRTRTIAPRPSAAHPARRSSSSSLLPWLIVVADLMWALLAGLVWDRRRRRQAAAVTAHQHEQPRADRAAAPSEPVPAASPLIARGSGRVRDLSGFAADSPVPDGPEPAGVEGSGQRQGAADKPLAPGEAAFELAFLLERTGDHTGAVEALQRAEERGHPAAAFHLGALLLRAGDVAGAYDAYARADQRGDPEAAAAVGVLLEHRGDLAAAAAAYERADRRGHAGAAWKLGSLLEERGDRAAAEAAYGRAEQHGAPMAAYDLGRLLECRGDYAGAEAAYRRADEHGHARAAFNLGALLLQAGDLAGAQDAYERADQRGDPDAACNLGVLLEQRGELAAAMAAYVRADERGHAVGAWNLAALLEEHGDRAAASAAFQRASERGYALDDLQTHHQT
jgi:peptidoglycan hydrolase-like protein with peptidoglycan-binding domain/TPR repeat protein